MLGRWIFYLSFITVLGALFFGWGRCRYDRKGKIEAFEEVEDFLKESMERIRVEREQEKLILAKLATNIKDIRKGVEQEEEVKAMAVNNPLMASQISNDSQIIEQVEEAARELHPKDEGSISVQRVEDHENIMRSR